MTYLLRFFKELIVLLAVVVSHVTSCQTSARPLLIIKS